jgi:hypothetical protein
VRKTGGVIMHTITVRVRAVDFADHMTAMRIWLDQHRLEPSRFRYSEDGDDISIDVSFEDTVEAAGFSARFNGEGTRTTANLTPTVEPETRIDVAGDDPIGNRQFDSGNLQSQSEK